MKKFNFKTLLLAIGLVVASTQPIWAGKAPTFETYDCKLKCTNYSSNYTLSNYVKSADLGITTYLTMYEYHGKVHQYGGNDYGNLCNGYLMYWIKQDGSNVVSPTQVDNSGMNWPDWDNNNRYPDFYWTGSIDLVSTYSLAPGDYTFYCQQRATGNQGSGDCYESTFASEQSATFTIPGFTTTSTSKDFGTVTVNSESSTSKISFGTHYGTALTTGNCSSLTDFKVTAIDESGVTVKFTPKSAGNKSETLTITDAHGKTCTITLTGKTQYAVTYKKGTYGTGSDVTKYKVYGINLTLLDKGSFTCTGYVQTAWNTNADGTSGTSYDLKGTYTSEAALTLYPTWQVQTHTVTFGVGTGMSLLGSIHINVDGGADITTSPQEVGESSRVVFTASPITGYRVAGWYSDPTCSQTITGAGTGTSYTIERLAKAETVYVKFIPKTYTNTLSYTNGGSGCTTVTTTFDSNTLTYNTTWTTPTKTGYDFTGYWASASKSTEQSPVALVINTNGELVANASGYTGENGIWKKDATTTLYAQWNEKITTVTIGVNDVAMGSVAPGEVNVGIDTKVQVVATPSIGYHWTDWTFSSTAISCTTNNATTNLKTNGSLENGSTGTATAVFAPNVYNITYKDQGGGSFTGTHEQGHPTTHTYATETTLKGATKTGYTFQGWFKEQDCSGTRITELGATDYTDNITLYAKWDINTYTISYPQTTEHYTINDSKTVRGQFGSTASFSITPEDGYRVYVTITYGSSQSVTYSHTRDAKEYSFNIPAGDVTVNIEVQPYQIGGSFNSWGDKYNFDSNHSLALNLNAETTYEFKLYNDLYKPAKENISTDGYVGFSDDWNIYESMQNGAMTYAQDSKCFKLHTGAAGNYTITIGNVNNVPAISVTYPNEKKIVIDHSSSTETLTFTQTQNPNIWVSQNVTLERNKSYTFHLYWNGAYRGYNGTMSQGSHKDWSMLLTERAVPWINTGDNGYSAGTYYFKYDVSNNQLTAVYPSFITGTMNSWGFTPLTFVNNVAMYDYESDGSQFMYKIIDDGVYYGKKDATTIDRSATFTLEPTQAENRNVVVNPNGSGTYTITYNNSTKDNTVQFPDNTKYDVTVYYDGITATPERAGATGGLALRAVTKPGYRFAGWVVEGVADAVHVEEPQNEATILYCFKDGGVVRATYSNDKFIYFKNTTNWGSVYVQFYPNDKKYMDNDKGTGTCRTGSSNEALVNATIYTMTHIDKTDIWYYDCSGFWDNINSSTLAFTSDKQDNHQYFDNCDVVYRGDFSKGNTNLFVPENFIHRYLNKHDQDKKHYEAHYYDRGYWLKYQDTHSGWKVEVYDVKKGTATETKTEELISKTPGNYTYQATINLTKGETFEYGMKLHNMYNGLYMSHAGTITSANCTNRKGWYETVSENCVLTADGNGDYLFTVTFSNGEVTMSVGYPPSNGDWRVIATKDAKTYETGYTYKPEANKKDTASFFVTEGSTIVLQKLNGGTVGNPNWDNVQTITNPTAGIMNYLITQGADGTTATLTEIGEYKGDFYIRTDGVDGGWDGFLTSDDNLMADYGSMLSDGNGFQYDFYKTKWVESGKNVKFRIANKYNKYLSADSETDSYISSEQNLQQSANVRFMWNSEDNTLKRAYLSGSTLSKDRFLVLLGNTYMDGQVARPYMFDENGNEITAGGEAEDDPRKGLNAHELLMKDKNNWVYQVDIKAIPSCAVKLTAAYNSKVQYFIGTISTSADGYKTIISGNGTDKYTMRVVYDFKTNLLIAGWVPDDKEIGEQISLGGDMLISRTHQDDAQQIRFGTGGSIEDIHHVYSVLTIKKDVMLGQNESGYSTAATNTDYERTMYWISFPFDVKISEVFGVDGYGKKWIMQRYNGEKRAEIGWFQETETFWEYLAPTSTLQAYKGYLLILNANYFNTNGADVWKNSATEANFYFPSAEKNIGIINKSSVDVPVPAHVCGINRPFADDPKKNHTITDSYWNVIGVPAFQDAPAVAALAEGCNLKSYYKWKSEDNTYEAETVDIGTQTFKTMHAYMVQFGGILTWENVSVVNNPTTAPYHYADAKNYRIELFFNGNGAEDHTYINLADGASTDFVLNEDMMKIDNAGFPNIYSFAGAYDVAYNETKMENQSVMLGVSAPKDGSYTFAMPKDFSGKAILIDLESGEATDLNLSDYTVELNKGTYNNRFQLLIEVEAKAPTAIDNAKGEWSVDGKTKKLFINDNIYLINAGRIYNVLGE